MNPTNYAKAIVGALLAGLGALAVGLEDGIMTPVEWIAVITTTLAAFGVVFGVPNTPPDGDGEHRAE